MNRPWPEFCNRAAHTTGTLDAIGGWGGRSGERRVGEERRSRGGPDHLKKKKKERGGAPQRASGRANARLHRVDELGGREPESGRQALQGDDTATRRDETTTARRARHDARR